MTNQQEFIDLIMMPLAENETDKLRAEKIQAFLHPYFLMGFFGNASPVVNLNAPLLLDDAHGEKWLHPIVFAMLRGRFNTVEVLMNETGIAIPDESLTFIFNQYFNGSLKAERKEVPHREKTLAVLLNHKNRHYINWSVEIKKGNAKFLLLHLLFDEGLLDLFDLYVNTVAKSHPEHLNALARYEKKNVSLLYKIVAKIAVTDSAGHYDDLLHTLITANPFINSVMDDPIPAVLAITNKLPLTDGIRALVEHTIAQEQQQASRLFKQALQHEQLNYAVFIYQLYWPLNTELELFQSIFAEVIATKLNAAESFFKILFELFPKNFLDAIKIKDKSLFEFFAANSCLALLTIASLSKKLTPRDLGRSLDFVLLHTNPSFDLMNFLFQNNATITVEDVASQREQKAAHLKSYLQDAIRRQYSFDPNLKVVVAALITLFSHAQEALIPHIIDIMAEAVTHDQIELQQFLLQEFDDLKKTNSSKNALSVALNQDDIHFTRSTRLLENKVRLTPELTRLQRANLRRMFWVKVKNTPEPNAIINLFDSHLPEMNPVIDNGRTLLQELLDSPEHLDLLSAYIQYLAINRPEQLNEADQRHGNVFLTLLVSQIIKHITNSPLREKYEQVLTELLAFPQIDLIPGKKNILELIIPCAPRVPLSSAIKLLIKKILAQNNQTKEIDFRQDFEDSLSLAYFDLSQVIYEACSAEDKKKFQSVLEKLLAKDKALCVAFVRHAPLDFLNAVHALDFAVNKISYDSEIIASLLQRGVEASLERLLCSSLSLSKENQVAFFNLLFKEYSNLFMSIKADVDLLTDLFKTVFLFEEKEQLVLFSLLLELEPSFLTLITRDEFSPSKYIRQNASGYVLQNFFAQKIGYVEDHDFDLVEAEEDSVDAITTRDEDQGVVVVERVLLMSPAAQILRGSRASLKNDDAALVSSNDHIKHSFSK